MLYADNAILIGPCKSKIPIDGSLSNAFEYFYFAWVRNKNIRLIIDTTKQSLEIIKRYLNFKYNIDSDCFNNIIVFEKKIQYFKNLILFEVISIDNFNNYYKLFLKSKNLYALSGSNSHELNCEYFCEYDFLVPQQIPQNLIKKYKSKIYFDILKCPTKESNKIFINTRDKTYIKKENEIIRADLNIFDNIFNQFNRMIYIQHPLFFDRKPRLFQECQYFKIPYEFIPHNKCYDGANERANDFDLHARIMSENDEIIRILLS